MIHHTKGGHVVSMDHPQLPEEVLIVAILTSSVTILWAKSHVLSQPFLWFLLPTIRVESWTETRTN